MTTLTPSVAPIAESDDHSIDGSEGLAASRKAFKMSLDSVEVEVEVEVDHTLLIKQMQAIVDILLAQKQFAEALSEIEGLKNLAASHKKTKIAMLEMKGRIKQVGARSGFRSRATKKYTTKRVKKP